MRANKAEKDFVGYHKQGDLMNENQNNRNGKCSSKSSDLYVGQTERIDYSELQNYQAQHPHTNSIGDKFNKVADTIKAENKTLNINNKQDNLNNPQGNDYRESLLS